MRLYEQTDNYVAESETEAGAALEKFRKEAYEKGYIIKKSGYTHKEKKAKGEVIDEKWLVSVTKVIGGIWDDNE